MKIAISGLVFQAICVKKHFINFYSDLFPQNNITPLLHIYDYIKSLL